MVCSLRTVMSQTFTDNEERECRNAFPSDKKYQVIYADPPWRYASTGNLKEKPYRTMSLQELKDLPVKEIRDKDSALFLWTVNPLLDKAIELMAAWGFKYKTVYKVWTKRNHPSGKPAVTPGYWSLSSTELLLIGVHGAMQKYKRVFNDKQEVAEPRHRHSEKPASVREDIGRLLLVPSRIELFSRHICEGWDAWGLDVPGYLHRNDEVSKTIRGETVRVKIVENEHGGIDVNLKVVENVTTWTQTSTFTARDPVHSRVALRPRKKVPDYLSKW